MIGLLILGAYLALAATSYRPIVCILWHEARRDHPGLYDDSDHRYRDEPHDDDRVFGVICAIGWPFAWPIFGAIKLVRSKSIRERAEKRRLARLTEKGAGHA